MPQFEIAYSVEPTSKAVAFEKVFARSYGDAREIAERGLDRALRESGAKCFRIVDAQGMVVSRGPAARRT